MSKFKKEEAQIALLEETHLNSMEHGKSERIGFSKYSTRHTNQAIGEEWSL